MSAAGASTAAPRAWAEGPEGAKDVVAYVNETPALYAIFLELHLLEQLEAEDDGSVAWDTIFTVANHWRENELARAAAPIDAEQLAAVKDQCETGLQAEHECPAMFALASIYADLFVGETITPVPEAEAAADDRHTEVRRLHEAITRLAPQFGLPWKETWEQLTEAEKDCLALAIAEVFPPSGGWCIRHVDGRWRTMDSLGMPDWTDDPAKALCCRLREHVDAYAVDDPEDVRIVPALAISERLPQLGGTYATQDGGSVKMVGIHYAGTDNETLVDEVGVNRYSRRLFDGGRVTGTAHDYSHPGNLVRPISALKLEMISAPSHVGQNADELIRELREWSQQHLAMTAIEIIEEAQALMSKAANALASTPSTTGRNAGLEEAALRCEQSASAFRSMKSAQDGTPDKDAELAEEMAYCCLLQARWIREMQSKTPGAPAAPLEAPGARERLRLAMLFIEEWSNWWSYALGVDDDAPMPAEEKAAAEKMAESLGARARDMVIDNRRFLASQVCLPAPSPLGGFAAVLAEYDGIVDGRLDPRDAEADFVMRGSDWRVIREEIRQAEDRYRSAVHGRSEFRQALREARALPAGWRAALAKVRLGLAAGSRSLSNTAFEMEYGGTLLDAVEEALEGLEVAPATLVEAVRWILQDAAYKAPELIGEVAERWIDRLRDAMANTVDSRG